jgi:mediator of RNA polymerase II transcription subunit 14
MPGVLVMPPSGADGASGPNEGGSLKRSHDGKLINGDRIAQAGAVGPVANGAVSTSGINGGARPAATPSNPVAANSSSIMKQLDQLPPEMAFIPPEIPHISSDNYHQYSVLVERVAQETFNDLKDTLAHMGQIAIHQQSNGVFTNGAVPHSNANGLPQNAEANRMKKLAMANFAYSNRAKFIKLLVILEWGKKYSRDISSLVDVTNWAMQVKVHMDSMHASFSEMHTTVSSAKQPNPDVRTALQILATGKASWIPDVSFSVNGGVQ